MCYSWQASIIAWIISVSIAIYLWKRNTKYDRWNAAFIISFAFIQLWEAGIWWYGDKFNEMFTKLILITLSIQPFVQTWFAGNTTNNNILKQTSIIYLIIIGISIYRVFTENMISTVGPNGHLVWNTEKNGSYEPLMGSCRMIPILYLLGLFVPLLFAIKYQYPLLIIGIITFIATYYFAKSNEFGSLWCYSAVTYSIVALFI